MPDNNPTIPKLSDLLRMHADAAARGLYFAMPGRVESYDAALTTATVSIMMKAINEKTDQIDDQDDEPAALANGRPDCHDPPSRE